MAENPASNAIVVSALSVPVEDSPQGLLRASVSLDIMGILSSPLLTQKAYLAHELGLLSPLLAGQLEEAMGRASELLALLGVDMPPDLLEQSQRAWPEAARAGKLAADLLTSLQRKTA